MDASQFMVVELLVPHIANESVGVCGAWSHRNACSRQMTKLWRSFLHKSSLVDVPLEIQQLRERPAEVSLRMPTVFSGQRENRGNASALDQAESFFHCFLKMFFISP